MVEEKMRISLLIANYNTSDLTIKCVKSILDNCDFSKGDKEIVIYDDGSSYEEQQKLCNSGKSFQENYPDKILRNVMIITDSKNHGIGFAMNEAIQIAKGKYCLRLDNDTLIIEKDFDEKLVKFLEDEKELGLVTCLTDNISSPSQKIVIPELFKEDDKQILEFVKNRPIKDIIYYDKPQHCFAGFCMAFRKKEVGLFDISSKFFGEDNLKYLEYIKKGMKCGVAQKLFIRHLYHGTTSKIPKEEIEKASKIAREKFMVAITT